MRISPVTTSMMPKMNFAGKQIDTYEGKPVVELDDQTPDDAIVAVGSWDSAYRYPVYAWQVREQNRLKAEKETAQQAPEAGKVETPEEYYARKINSPEWGAY